MQTEDYNFEVPEHLIAQHPAAHRSDSKMLVYYRDSKKIEDRMFKDLPEILDNKYHLVFNNSRVISSRLAVVKESTGHKGELLILKLEDANHAVALTDKSKKYNNKGEDFNAKGTEKVFSDFCTTNNFSIYCSVHCTFWYGYLLIFL